ncbi:hypothetical protein [Acuticoccus sp. I52.16.1]|uniref:hypothetical protein n=1 Tax=Acuticoccus sp. I52.16.1 TaxID=2928472 RepID=UPI001FD106AB|nr:hypothetical protein [Acuticoccus sp. I52.16.1]UOM36767.1 hypothetical protein MRB58_11530 [Acuticoccus sp. I52.16.1]
MMYYGILPAILRSVFEPFVDLTVVPVARAVVWVTITLIGTVAAVVLYCSARPFVTSGRGRSALAAFSLVAGFLCSPAIMLSTAAPLYYEPIAIGVLATLLFILIALPALFGHPLGGTAIVFLGLLAALAFLVRPHMAVGLCLSIFLLWLALGRRSGGTLRVFFRPGQFMPIVAAGLLVAAALVVYLELSTQRNGSAFVLRSLANDVATKGNVFLGYEDVGSARMRAFEENGTFNLKRIASNSAFYLVGANPLTPRLERALQLGYIRKETQPVLIDQWALWFAMSAVFVGAAVACVRRPSRLDDMGVSPLACIAVLVGTLVSAVMILSYGTVAYRYACEFWPALFVASALGLRALAFWLCRATGPQRLTAIVFLMLLTGGSSVQSLDRSARNASLGSNLENKDFMLREECLERIAMARTTRALPTSLCDLPGVGDGG